jgi:hypothetical protein
LGEAKTRIFLISGLDTISENQKRFARRVDLLNLYNKIALLTVAAACASARGATCAAFSMAKKAGSLTSSVADQI